MKYFFYPVLAATLLACTATPGSAPINTDWLVADASAIQTHVEYLASDELRGREAGTQGYDDAAKYVADQFRQLGLQPAGDAESYFQMVPLRRGFRQKERNDLTIVDRDGNSLELIENTDYAIGGAVRNAHVSVTAPIVFVGYGLVAPEQDRDDYAGVDVEGKFVAVLSRTPSGMQSEERAFYGARKAIEASKRGAIGVISLSTPLSEQIFPFLRFVASGFLDSASMGWVQADGRVFSRAPNIRGGAALSLSGSAKLLEAAGVEWKSIEAAAMAQGGRIDAFEMPLTVTLEQHATQDDIQSPNVAAFLEGSDPVLKDEVIVLTAHLDHLGVATRGGEERIYNGAMDNAAGIATMLEAAAMLSKGPRLRRSVLFLAVTAEEKGLLGAEYFAQNPTVPMYNIVGNINLDMPLLTYDFTDVIVYGGERSTLRSAIEQAGEQMNISVSPDPFPEQGIFTRSDHFRFVEEGVPSVMLATGHANGGGAAWAKHLSTDYHQPTDDLNLPINWSAAARFAELNTRILVTVANANVRPLWNAGDFFARQFDGPMQPRKVMSSPNTSP